MAHPRNLTRPARAGLIFGAFLGASLGMAGAAQADDKAAIEHFNEANKVWKTDATKCQAELEAALKETDPESKNLQSRVIRANILRALGIFHQAKTGNFEEAITCYRTLLRETVGAKHPRLTNQKAQALLNLGTIYYSVKKDVNEAVTKYKDAHATYPTAQTADTLSQILFRQARDSATSPPAAKKKIETALILAREAIMIDKKDPNKRSSPALRSKYRLQLVVVLTALGKKEEAEAEWREVDTKVLGDTALYQLAQLAALRGEGAEKVAGYLREAIAPKLRPAARARNQLRWFIRTEEDFKPFHKEASWKELLTDEPEDKK